MPATVASSNQNAVLASVAISPNDAFDAITDFLPLLDRLFCDGKRLPTKWITADTYIWLSKRTIGDVVLRTKQHKTLQPVIDEDAGAINLLRTFVTQLEQRLADIEWGKLIGVVYRLLELKLFRSPEDTANMPHHNQFHRESEFVRSDGFDLRSYACVGPKIGANANVYGYMTRPPAPRYWRMTLVNIAIHEPTLLDDMVKAATELKRPPVSVEATLLSLPQQPETLAYATASHT